MYFRWPRGELEHTFSRELVEGLTEMLHAVGSEVAAGLEHEAPFWVHTVEAWARPLEECAGKWTVATEEGVGIVRFYPFDSQLEANFYFDSFHVCLSRVLLDPHLVERKRAGANLASFGTILKSLLLPAAAVPGAASLVRGKWTVATEEGSGNVRLYSSESEAAAKQLFNEMHVTSRILVDPNGAEVQRAGWNPLAHRAIRRRLFAARPEADGKQAPVQE